MAAQMGAGSYDDAVRLTILGAGAIGGSVGAALALGGRRVELVDQDRAHVEAMRTKGMTVEGRHGTLTVPVHALLPDELDPPLEVVLLAVKAQHTRAALGTVIPLLRPWSVVVSMQNGLNEPVIAELVGADRTLGAFVNFGADVVAPGVIRTYGPDAFYVGELDGSLSARVDQLCRELAPWGEVTATANIMGYLWTKLGYVVMLAATALVNEDQVPVMRRFPELLIDLATEIYEVARAEGVRLAAEGGLEPHLYVPGADRDENALRRSFAGLVEYARIHHKPRSGIWRDLAVRRLKTEAGEHLGTAIQIGEGHGLSLPLTQRLLQLIHEVESGERGMSWESLVELDMARAAQVR